MSIFVANGGLPYELEASKDVYQSNVSTVSRTVNTEIQFDATVDFKVNLNKLFSKLKYGFEGGKQFTEGSDVTLARIVQLLNYGETNYQDASSCIVQERTFIGTDNNRNNSDLTLENGVEVPVTHRTWHTFWHQLIARSIKSSDNSGASANFFTVRNDLIGYQASLGPNNEPMDWQPPEDPSEPFDWSFMEDNSIWAWTKRMRNGDVSGVDVGVNNREHTTFFSDLGFEMVLDVDRQQGRANYDVTDQKITLEFYPGEQLVFVMQIQGTTGAPVYGKMTLTHQAPQ